LVERKLDDAVVVNPYGKQEIILKKQKNLTRREMLKLTGIVGAGSLLAACAPQAVKETATVQPTVPVQPTDAPTAVPTQVVPASTTLKVYNPTGAYEVTQTFAPRLDSLDGKTIAFVGDDMWEEERSFPLLQQLLQAKYPTIKILTADKFVHGADAITKANDGLPKQMQDAGVQGVIVGNAG
jgi:hypothetical protein